MTDTQKLPKAPAAGATTTACCDAPARETCCAPEAKAGCCGPEPAPKSCGCGGDRPK